MCIPAAVGIVTAALALSALAAPTAQADPKPAASKTAPLSAARGDETRGDTKITATSVGGNNNVVVAATQKKTFTIWVTATDDSGIQDAYAALWHGPDIRHADGILLPDLSRAQIGTCYEINATMSTCEVKIEVDARTDLDNSLAGTWKIWTAAVANDGDHVLREAFGTARVQRSAQVTVDAAPEPVKKGRTLTVTGRLTHASWTAGKNVAYTGQPVKLQFRKKGTDTFATLKTVRTDGRGNLRTTVKATADGQFRYTFFGDSSNPATTYRTSIPSTCDKWCHAAPGIPGAVRVSGVGPPFPAPRSAVRRGALTRVPAVGRRTARVRPLDRTRRPRRPAGRARRPASSRRPAVRARTDWPAAGAAR